MSEKTKQLLQKLKEITDKEPQPQIIDGVVVSNGGADRIYQYFHGSVYLVNKDNSYYQGKITKKFIKITNDRGETFRSYVYETADGRWFDRAGRPTTKPKQTEAEDSEESPTE